MTPDAFVALGTGLARVQAKSVMGAVRLVVGDKVFATVDWPEAGWAVVRLSPGDQQGFLALSHAVTPEPGPRGRKGITLVHLRGVGEVIARRVLIAAWRHALSPGQPLAEVG